MSLLDKLTALAQLRETAKQAKATVMGLRTQFEVDNAVALTAARNAELSVVEAEEVVREAALIEYRETGNKTPERGIQIKIGAQLKYDETKALEWAKAHDLAFTYTLDKVLFGKIALGMPEEQRAREMPFVKVEEMPRATLAVDLKKALEAEAQA